MIGDKGGDRRADEEREGQYEAGGAQGVARSRRRGSGRFGVVVHVPEGSEAANDVRAVRALGVQEARKAHKRRVRALSSRQQAILCSQTE